MAASTIPNSGGPGSSVKLSPVTIAVRDKVIEKFADQPLDEMNESVKQLLFKEEDEQKRLGILAARVYILRQRILRISEGDPDRVVGSVSPKANDLMADSASEQDSKPVKSEWTRLRIIDDCEVNGVRFPKTVVIDVKAEDAERLIASGNAKLVEDQPAGSTEAPADDVADNITEDAADEAVTVSEQPADAADVEDTAGDDAESEDAGEDTSGEDTGGEDTGGEDTGGDDTPADDIDELSALSAALGSAPAPKLEETDTPEAAAKEENGGEAVIDAPSAAEVTAALEALSTGDMSDSPEEAESAEAPTTATPEPTPDAAADAADVAAELEALSASLASSDDDAPASEMTNDAADVAAELQAAAAAMAADAAGETAEGQLSASGQEAAEDDADKPGGWFEAQQKAEQSSAADTEADESGDRSDEDEDESDNAKP